MICLEQVFLMGALPASGVSPNGISMTQRSSVSCSLLPISLAEPVVLTGSPCCTRARRRPRQRGGPVVDEGLDGSLRPPGSAPSQLGHNRALKGLPGRARAHLLEGTPLFVLVTRVLGATRGSLGSGGGGSEEQ
jgi:hypothetical protein